MRGAALYYRTGNEPVRDMRSLGIVAAFPVVSVRVLPLTVTDTLPFRALSRN